MGRWVDNGEALVDTRDAVKQHDMTKTPKIRSAKACHDVTSSFRFIYLFILKINKFCLRSITDQHSYLFGILENYANIWIHLHLQPKFHFERVYP